MKKEIEMSIENYNRAGKGITTATAEAIKDGEFMNVKVTEPWKTMSGVIIGTFRADDASGIQMFLDTRAEESKRYIAVA